MLCLFMAYPLLLILVYQTAGSFGALLGDEPFPPTDVSACAYKPNKPVVLVLNCTRFPGTVVEAKILASNLDLSEGNSTCHHRDSDTLCPAMDLLLNQMIPDCLDKEPFCLLESRQPQLGCYPMTPYNYLVAVNFSCKSTQDINIINICRPSSSTTPANGTLIQSPNYPKVYPKTREICHQTMGPGHNNQGYFEFRFSLINFHIEESNGCDRHSTEYVKINSTQDFYVELRNAEQTSVGSGNYIYNQAVYLCNEAGVDTVIIFGYDAIIEFKIADLEGTSSTGFNIEYRVFNATEPTRGPSPTDIDTTNANDVTMTSKQDGEPEGGNGISQEVMLTVVIVGVTLLVGLVIAVLIIIIKKIKSLKNEEQSLAGSETSNRMLDDTGHC